VAGALNHEVFRAQRFSRSGGNCPVMDNRRGSTDLDEIDNLVSHFANRHFGRKVFGQFFFVVDSNFMQKLLTNSI
jgi:hypothetical protein